MSSSRLVVAETTTVATAVLEAARHTSRHALARVRDGSGAEPPEVSQSLGVVVLFELVEPLLKALQLVLDELEAAFALPLRLQGRQQLVCERFVEDVGVILGLKVERLEHLLELLAVVC